MDKPGKYKLGQFPTPIQKLESLSREFGVNIYIKRDDLCGIALGGNKVRKLEYLLYDAVQRGYSLVMTTGQAQSNHAMLTAACARMLSLDCVLVLKKRGVTARKGNQILNYLLDTEVVYVDTDNYSDIYEEMDRIAAGRNRSVYKIPCGGSNGLGSIGYVDCMEEISNSGICFSDIVVACGSGGTSAGVALGAALWLPGTHITLSKVDSDPFEAIVPGIIEEAKQILETDISVPAAEYLDLTGDGYSIPSEEGNEAIRKLFRTEGILLDTCYTGKAFAGLLRKLRQGKYKKGENILFIHTGGAGGLFAQDWERL